MAPGLNDIRELDRRDPLAGFKPRFALPESVIYLDGNSLGAQPVAAATHPFDTPAGDVDFAQTPQEGEKVWRTFCGT